MAYSPYYCLPALLAFLLVVYSAKSNDAVVAAFLTENRFCAAPTCMCTLVKQPKQPSNVCVSRIFHVNSSKTILSAKTSDDGNDKYLGALDRAVQTGDTRKLGKRKKLWVERCLELAEYKREHGNCDVPYPKGKGETRTQLQNWIPNQRTAYRLYQQDNVSSSMTKEKIAILEGMDFKWKITGWSGEHAGWKMRYEELIEYKWKYDNCNVPLGWEKNPKLARWVNNQRTQYRYLKEGKPSDMTKERIDMLEKIGFDWYLVGPYTDWVLRYEELKQYKGIYGDCNVPQHWDENPQLGLWVNSQRTEYRWLKEGKKSSMTDERIEMLEKLEFDWNLNVDWELRYEELRQYKERCGDCNVPQLWDENPQLGGWVHTQRIQYRLLKEGKKSQITNKRIAMLEKLGFEWYVYGPKVNWKLRYEELKDYQERYGDCNVPQKWKENPKLGRWVGTQRQQYRLLKEGKTSQMTDERIEMLEKIGLEWTVDKRRKQKK